MPHPHLNLDRHEHIAKLINISKELDIPNKNHKKKFDKIITNIKDTHPHQKLWFIIGLVANILMVISLVPSLKGIADIKNAKAFPYSFILLNFLCNSLFVVYGAGTKSYMTLMMGAICFVYFVIIFYFKAILKW